jgi:hypothetical protein
MKKKRAKILIEGVTETGEDFRPSDWAERMSERLSTFKKRRIHYSPMLQPSIKDGHQCVVLDPTLKETNPALYLSILEFAKNNKLKICQIEEENSNDAQKP